MQFAKTIRFAAVVSCATLTAATPAFALYIPDKLFRALFTDFGDMPTSGANINGNTAFFQNITPIPSQVIIEDPVLNGGAPPAGEPGGAFERNEHMLVSRPTAKHPAGRIPATIFSAASPGISPST